MDYNSCRFMLQTDSYWISGILWPNLTFFSMFFYVFWAVGEISCLRYTFWSL